MGCFDGFAGPCSLQAIVYMGTTAESLLWIPRVQDRLRETMYRICIYPEHRRPDFPILPAEVEHRAIYGAGDAVAK